MPRHLFCVFVKKWNRDSNPESIILVGCVIIIVAFGLSHSKVKVVEMIRPF